MVVEVRPVTTTLRVAAPAVRQGTLTSPSVVVPANLLGKTVLLQSDLDLATAQDPNTQFTFGLERFDGSQWVSWGGTNYTGAVSINKQGDQRQCFFTIVVDETLAGSTVRFVFDIVNSITIGASLGIV